MESPADFSRGLRLEAPARLHMGFLDLDGSLGRQFGSLGVGLEGLSTCLSLRPSDDLIVEGPEAERALSSLHRLGEALGRRWTGHLTLSSCVPSHAGLGSGTQMALAVGIAMSRLHGLSLTAGEVAHLCGRGRRSGIGIATFEAPGLVVDAGRGPKTEVPPVIARLALPSDWRFLILRDPITQGLHGRAEVEAFAELPPFPRAVAADLCHRVLMQALPALMDQDLDRFGEAIEALQRAVGDHFAPRQGGRFTSPTVAKTLEWAGNLGARARGQGSWGPTGFCLMPSPEAAEQLILQLRRDCAAAKGLLIDLAAPARQGARLTPL